MKRKHVDQDLLGFHPGRGVGQSELTGEAVLKGSPEPLDSPLGLGRVGQDHLHPELVKQAPELGWATPAGELLLQRQLLVLGHVEDRVAVAVDRHRDAVPHHHLVHELEVAFGILLVAEDSPGNHVGGIVNAAYQAEARSSALEPVVRAGINLEKHALLGVAVAALPMLWWAAGAGSREAGRR